MKWEVEDLLVRCIQLFHWIAVFFLGFRVLFQLLGVNPKTPFVFWVYTFSSFLLIPLRNIFHSPEISGVSVLDITSLVALFLYTLIAALSVAFIQSLAQTKSHHHKQV